MLIKVGWKKDFIEKSVPGLPISGWMGDNLIKKTENMGWWSGQDILVEKTTMHIDTLYDCLNDMCSPPGRIEPGLVKPNEEVIYMPTHTPANACGGKVFTI